MDDDGEGGEAAAPAAGEGTAVPEMISMAHHEHALREQERRLRVEFAAATAALEETLHNRHLDEKKEIRETHQQVVDDILVKHTTEHLGPFAGIMQEYESGNAALREAVTKLNTHCLELEGHLVQSRLELEGQLVESQLDRSAAKAEAEKRRSAEAKALALKAQIGETHAQQQQALRDVEARVAAVLQQLQTDGAERLKSLAALMLQQQRTHRQQLAAMQVAHLDEVAAAKKEYICVIARLTERLQKASTVEAAPLSPSSSPVPSPRAPSSPLPSTPSSAPMSSSSVASSSSSVASSDLAFSDIEERINALGSSLSDTTKDLVCMSAKIDLFDISKHEVGITSPLRRSKQEEGMQQLSDEVLLKTELAAASDLTTRLEDAHETAFAEALKSLRGDIGTRVNAPPPPSPSPSSLSLSSLTLSSPSSSSSSSSSSSTTSPVAPAKV
jgi:hypothetical protein